jgi:hypothetical protein
VVAIWRNKTDNVREDSWQKNWQIKEVDKSTIYF